MAVEWFDLMWHYIDIWTSARHFSVTEAQREDGVRKGNKNIDYYRKNNSQCACLINIFQMCCEMHVNALRHEQYGVCANIYTYIHINQTTLKKCFLFFSKKIFVYSIWMLMKFNLFLTVKLTIIHHWFRYMAWCQADNNPFSELMINNVLTHWCLKNTHHLTDQILKFIFDIEIFVWCLKFHSDLFQGITW